MANKKAGTTTIWIPSDEQPMWEAFHRKVAEEGDTVSNMLIKLAKKYLTSTSIEGTVRQMKLLQVYNCLSATEQEAFLAEVTTNQEKEK